MAINSVSILVAVVIPFIRSIGGWATKAVADGKISKFELKELGKTVIRTGIIGLMIFVGADGFGIDINVIGSSASAVIFDMILSAWKENRNITKR